MLKNISNEFCDSSLWNSSIFYDESPDFTNCFHKTIIIWLPCLILYLYAPDFLFTAIKMRDHTKKGLNRLNQVKIFVTLIMLGLEVASLFANLIKWTYFEQKIYLVDFFKPLILTLTYVLIIFMIYTCDKAGIQYSVILMVYWLASLICATLTLRSKFLALRKQLDRTDAIVDFFMFFLVYSLLIINLVISFLSENNKKFLDPKTFPETTASLFSWLTFNYMTGLINKGYRNDLSKESVWDVDTEESCKKLGDDLEIEWNRMIKAYSTEKHKKFQTKFRKCSIIKPLQFETNGKEMFFKKPEPKMPSLSWCLFRIHLNGLVQSGILNLTHDILDLLGALILDQLIRFIADKKETSSIGYFLTFILFIRLTIQSFCLHHYFNYAFKCGARARSSLMNLIYKKSLKLSTESRRKADSGEIMNLMQVNTQTLIDFSMRGHIIWACPIKIILTAILLWFYIGPAVFAGLSALFLILPLNSLSTKLYSKYETRKLNFRDSRIKIINEVLNGIKVIKFYGWEISFERIINKLRDLELNLLKKYTFCYSIFNFSFGFTTYVVTLTTLATFVYSNEKNKLDPSTAYVTLSLINAIRIQLFLFGPAMSSFIQTKVSLNRIQKFLLLEEIDGTQISNYKNSEIAISYKNVNLSWNNSNEDILLKRLNFVVPRGKLVAVIGKVGSGKSSLLSSILGEMYKLTGNINVDGSISYVPQQAWIQNATVKENILFGNGYFENFYLKVIKSCALANDLKVLAAGDRTEIGEKGINLSGGQKQRISLCRAAYNNSDIYLLDDPLSAVDAHVGKHIFENVIGPNGILKDKTRVFVTNSMSFLPFVDEILMLENGTIVEAGSYEHLIKLNGSFSKFLKNSFRNENKENDKEKSEQIEYKNKEEQLMVNVNSENVEKIIEIEKCETGNVKLRCLIEYFKSCSLLMVFGFFICYSLMNTFQVLSSFWLSQWSDRNLTPADTKTNNHTQLLVYGLLGLVQHIFSFTAEMFSVQMVIMSSKGLHQGMLKSILKSSMKFFESTPIGRILNRFSKDINSVEFLIPFALKETSFCAFEGIAVIIIISITTPLFLTAFVPIAICFFLIQRYFVSSSSKLKRLDSISKSPIYACFAETLNGISTIKAYKAQQRFIKSIENKIDQNNAYVYPSFISDRWLGIMMENLTNLITVFASIFAILAKNDITPGLAGLTISFSLNVSRMLRYMVKMASDLESNLTSVERIKEYCNTPQEAEWINQNYRPPSNWPDKGEIKFVNYSVKYREDLNYALKTINCEIKSSEKIGIVGRTGAGKSSLSQGLFRLLEIKEGDIIIDNINIKRIGLHDLRQRLTIIPQDPVLFSGTLRMNLDPFDQFSDEDLWQALEKAHLKEFVESLEDKLLFECSEGGENLSVGQRQLLCLARALLRNTKILLLDEATAAIDHNTDDLIQATIRSAFADCTVLTIAHRLHTILDSDRIMVLDKGRIVEFDSPRNLIDNTKSVFYSMLISAGIISS